MRTIQRMKVSWFETISIFVLTLATAWYVGWSPFVEPHWARQWIGMLFAVMAVWAIVFSIVQKDFCQIHARKRLLISSTTTWYFKRIVTQYPWDHFCIVRAVLVHREGKLGNRVELVSKSMYSVLVIAYFPAVTKPDSRTLFTAYEYENPLAKQLRSELSLLMSLSDQGYIEEHYLTQLP